MLVDSLGNPLGSPTEKHQFNQTGLGPIFSKLNPFHMPGTELPQPLDFEDLAARFWRRNAICYAAIRKISGSAAEPEVVAKTRMRDGQLRLDKDSDVLFNLIRNPNPEQDGYELIELLLIHLMVTGNAFIHKLRSRKGNVVGLELIRPDLVTIKPGSSPLGGKVAHYSIATVDKDIVLSPLDVIHFKLPDALHEHWGLSPLYVLARNGDIDEQATDFLRAYFLNRGVPAGMLVHKGMVNNTDRDRVRHQWKDQLQGSTGWHDIAILDSDVSYHELSSGLKNLELQPIFDQTETRIAMVFGVPPILLGTSAGLERSTFSNFVESRRGFWTETLTPLYVRIQRRLTKMLAVQEFGPNRVIEFDLAKVAGLQENKEEIWKRAIDGWDKALLTRNQALAMIDLPPDANGDVVKLSTSDLYVPLDQAVQFADLVGDVVTDVVQNEIDEATTDRVDGVEDPNPSIDRSKEEPSEQFNYMSSDDSLAETIKSFLSDPHFADDHASEFEELFPDCLELAQQIAEDTIDGQVLFDTGVSVLVVSAGLTCDQVQVLWDLAKVLERVNPTNSELRVGLLNAKTHLTGEPIGG